MEHFLAVSSTIPSGLGFRHFGMEHLLWLGGFAVFAAAQCLHFRKLDEKKRDRWRKVIAILLIADELFKTVCLILGGNYAMKYLPLELCSINLFLIAYHAWHPGKLLGNSPQ